MSDKVTVIGSGHCGCALTVDLLNRGWKVLLYSHPEHSSTLNMIEKNGFLRSSDLIVGDFTPLTSTDIAEAVAFSRFIFITVPAYGHWDIIKKLKSFELSDHIIICLTGNFFSFIARNHLKISAIIETSSSPYASRVEDASVKIMATKQKMSASLLSTSNNQALREIITRMIGMPVDWHDSSLDISFSCITGIIHPAAALMNSGWIESTHGDFYFYAQGMSNSVVSVMSEIDGERIAIAEAYGLKIPSAIDILNDYYESDFNGLSDFAKNSHNHNATKMSPCDLNHRFITQDIPFVLVPWFALGRKANINAPTIESLIHLSSTVHGKNYMSEGLSLARLGLDGMTKQEIMELSQSLI
jgi:opine dehydrogenase